MPKLFRIVLPVSNIDVAEKFYRELLGTPGERVSPGRHHFVSGNVTLACYDPWAEGDEPAGGWKQHPNQHIAFSVKDLGATLARVRAITGTHILEEIQTHTGGERSFYALDPFGNPLCFVDEATVNEPS
jgi:predicted enzyme related to lactoylglutathione lyase